MNQAQSTKSASAGRIVFAASVKILNRAPATICFANMPFDPTDPATIRDLSWIGDALLSLFAREWILQNEAQLGGMRADLFRDLTNNQFLSAIGQPSQVEARIGAAYRAGGLPAAQKVFDETLAPLFLKQHANRTHARGEHCRAGRDEAQPIRLS